MLAMDSICSIIYSQEQEHQDGDFEALMCMLSHAHQSGPAFSQDSGLQEADEEARSRCQCPHADTPCTHVAGH